jgi:hypothetical protein
VFQPLTIFHDNGVSGGASMPNGFGKFRHFGFRTSLDEVEGAVKDFVEWSGRCGLKYLGNA